MTKGCICSLCVCRHRSRNVLCHHFTIVFLLFDAMTWLISSASGSKSQMSIGFVFSILQKSYVYVSQLENLTKFLWNPLPSTYFLFIITTLPAKAFCVPTWQGRATQTQTNMSWRHGVWNDGVFLREHRPSCIYILLCGFGICKATAWFRKQMTHKTLQKQESIELLSNVKPNSPWNKWNHKCARGSVKAPSLMISVQDSDFGKVWQCIASNS